MDVTSNRERFPQEGRYLIPGLRIRLASESQCVNAEGRLDSKAAKHTRAGNQARRDWLQKEDYQFSISGIARVQRMSATDGPADGVLEKTL